MEEMPIKFKLLRRERQMSQDEIARLLGVSRQTIFAIENGKSEPSLSLALKISSLFEEDIEEVFSYLLEEELSHKSEGIKDIASITNSLIPFSPINDITNLHEEIDRFFQGTIATAPGVQTINLVNIHNSDEYFTVELAVAGFSEEDIDIEAGKDFLNIKGNKQVDKEEDLEGYLKREFIPSSFQRSIVLPNEIESEKIEADIKNGILTLKLPKLKPTDPKISKIKINKK